MNTCNICMIGNPVYSALIAHGLVIQVNSELCRDMRAQGPEVSEKKLC
jgi:hypothetical protein